MRKQFERHGLTGSPIRYVWKAMMARCHKEGHPQFHDYGGRGILVCDRWRSSVAAFAADMGPRPPNTSLDRVDNDKGYSPENCRWSTAYEQQCNRRVFKNSVSGVTGVTWDKTNNRWQVFIQRNGVKRKLGVSKDLDVAIRLRGQAQQQGV